MKNALAAAAASLFAVGCVYACTEMGCIGGLTFEMDIAKDGAWAIQLESDALIIDCEFELPADVGSIACTGADDYWVDLDLVAGASGYSGTMTVYDHTPDEVTFTAWLDGGLVSEISENPEYDEYYPNGERCDGDPCLSAIIDVMLD